MSRRRCRAPEPPSADIAWHETLMHATLAQLVSECVPGDAQADSTADL